MTEAQMRSSATISAAILADGQRQLGTERIAPWGSRDCRLRGMAVASSRSVSAPSYFETAIVMVARSGPQAQEKVDRLLSELAVGIVPSPGTRICRLPLRHDIAI
jgi:hypothetical protein